MSILDTLKQAITERKPISFEYNKEGKILGERIGNPHAVFVYTSKDGTRSVKAHIVQTAGVSDSKFEKPFPDFRMFDLDNIRMEHILSEQPPFSVSDKYNPNWEGYVDSIAKI